MRKETFHLKIHRFHKLIQLRLNKENHFGKVLQC